MPGVPSAFTDSAQAAGQEPADNAADASAHVEQAAKADAQEELAASLHNPDVASSLGFVPRPTDTESSTAAHEHTVTVTTSVLTTTTAVVPIATGPAPTAAALPEVHYNGVVAAEHPECSQIGVRLMRQGGSAVDATIGALLCIGVVNNFSSGIGGGGIMLVHASDGSTRAIDFRETAPAAASRDMFTGGRERASWSTESSLAVAVPGEIKGMAAAHALYGRLPWAALFSPAIGLARDGFVVTPKLADMISRNAERMRRDKGMTETFLRTDGTPRLEGERIVRPNLAKTLAAIAEDGPDAMYGADSWIARSIVRTVTERLPTADGAGGLCVDDFVQYRVRTDASVVRRRFGSFDVLAPGGATGGPLVLQVLAVLERLGVGRAQGDVRSAQRMLEAFKFAYAERMRLGDAAFVRGMDAVVAEMLSDKRVAEIAARITDDTTHDVDYYLRGVAADVRGTGTTSVSAFGTAPALDGAREWQAVSVTSTVNLEWGACVMDRATGIVLNNQMDDFAVPGAPNYFGVPPSTANEIAPGKRPLSSMAPVIMLRAGRPVLIAGGTGGSRIVTSVVQTVLNVVRFGMDAAAAVGACRLHHQLLPNYVMAEGHCDAALVRGLQRLGHEVLVLGPKAFASAVSLAMVARETDDRIRAGACKGSACRQPWTAASDPRKGGLAAGY